MNGLIKTEDGGAQPSSSKKKCAKVKEEPGVVPVKRKRDRFHGMPEEEVLKRTLPDLLVPGLDICIVGINPGLTAAYVGHHYAGPGNHFWKCLYLSGLIPEPLNAYDDATLRNYGIGFTNIVERTSRGSADLKRKEIAEGGEILKIKIQKYKPKIAVFNGKGIYEVFCGHKKFSFGKQPEPFPECPETMVYVMPSSSARCSQLPRAVDKVPFYLALKKLRDHLSSGSMHVLNEAEVTFPDLTLKTAVKQEAPPDGTPRTPRKKAKREATVAACAAEYGAMPVKLEPTTLPPAYQYDPGYVAAQMNYGYGEVPIKQEEQTTTMMTQQNYGMMPHPAVLPPGMWNPQLQQLDQDLATYAAYGAPTGFPPNYPGPMHHGNYM